MIEELMRNSLKNAVKVLREGGIILYPTDTIWGIGCDATNENAVRRVYEIKKRKDTKSMLVLIDNVFKLETYVEDIPEIAWDLIEISEKPLTIIYDGAKNLASNLISPDGSIGIRVTKELFSKTLCEAFKKPIVSSSANISEEETARNFSEISDEIKSKVDYIVEFAQEKTTFAKPSSIIKLKKGNLISIIRK